MPKGFEQLVHIKRTGKIPFYDGMPGKPGVNRNMLTPEELGERLGFGYNEGLVCAAGNKDALKLTEQQQETLETCPSIINPFEGIALANLGEPFGVCAIAERDFVEGPEVLGLYAGVVTVTKSPLNDPYGYTLQNHGMSVSASDTGGLGRFLAHLPTNLDDVEFSKGEHAKEEVACANVTNVVCHLNGRLVIVMQVTTPILKGQVLGYDYGHSYWCGLDRAPDLMKHEGALVPRPSYKRTWPVIIKLDLPDGQDAQMVGFDPKQIYEGFCNDRLRPYLLPPGSCGFKRGISAYLLMKKLVKANAFSAHYGPLPVLNDFTRSLQRYCQSQMVNVDVACYWQSPEAVAGGSDTLDAYSVDTVVSCDSKQSAGQVCAMLSTVEHRLQRCDQTHVVRVLATNTATEELQGLMRNLNARLQALVEGFEIAGCGRVASLADSGAPFARESRELQHQVLACRASMFAAAVSAEQAPAKQAPASTGHQATV